MLEFDPVDECACHDVPDTDAAVHRSVKEPLRVRLGEADIIDVVSSGLREITNSLKTSCGVEQCH